MLAGFLVVLVVIELAISVWCLTRWNGVRRELVMMEKHYDALSDALRNAALSAGTPVEVEPTVSPETLEMLRNAGADADAASDVLANASKEQLDAAAKLLDSLGIGSK